MKFSDVVGQYDVKAILQAQVDAGRLPHALLLAGDTGSGTLALALALANYVLCQNKQQGDSCGECSQCTKVDKLIHPDLHFSFPIIKKGSSVITCDYYMNDWLSHLANDKYFDLNDWLEVIGAENKQAIIPDDESDNIIRKLSLSSYEGGWKVMIIWLPEKMHTSAANTLLKTLEEPSKQTLFILCAEHPEEMLTTILSRTQRIDVPPLSTEVLSQALMERRGLDKDTAVSIARVSGGSYLKALKQLCDNDNAAEMFDSFVELMRMAYTKNLAALMKWSDNMASLGREEQKSYLAYMQHLLRECFMYNFGRPELNFMNGKERAFAEKFARFVNERNIVQFTEEFAHAQRDVIGNVNGKTIFFNLALHTIQLLRR